MSIFGTIGSGMGHIFSLHAIGEVIKAVTGIGDKKKEGEAVDMMAKIGGVFSDKDEIALSAQLRSLLEEADRQLFWEFVNWIFPQGKNPANMLGRQKMFQYVLGQPSVEIVAKVVKTSTQNVDVKNDGDTHNSEGQAKVVQRRSFDSRDKQHDGVKDLIEHWLGVIKSSTTVVAGFEKLKTDLKRENAPFMSYHGIGDDIDIDAIEKSVLEASENVSRTSHRIFATSITVAGTFIFGWWFLAVITILITIIFIFGGKK